MECIPSPLPQTILDAIYATRQLGLRYLWVDALCINWSDTAERNAQVALAPDIYQRATAVWAWVGEADDTSRTAVMAPAFSAMRRASGVAR